MRRRSNQRSVTCACSGYYTSGSAATWPDPCRAGQYSASFGSSSCALCWPGSYSIGGTSTCQPCPPYVHCAMICQNQILWCAAMQPCHLISRQSNIQGELCAGGRRHLVHERQRRVLCQWIRLELPDRMLSRHIHSQWCKCAPGRCRSIGSRAWHYIAQVCCMASMTKHACVCVVSFFVAPACMRNVSRNP